MRSHRSIRWLAIPALVAGVAMPSPAWAQQAPPPQQPPAQVPSVGVTPVSTSPNDPNNGQWFFIDGLQPGQVGQSEAKITNPADVPQTVHMYLADLNFAANGGVQVADKDKSVDIGSWGGFGQNATITIPAKTSQVVPFFVRVPQDAEAGDHVGSVVVETDPAPLSPGDDKNMLKIVRRVATRLYVTLPGEARSAFSIQKVTMEKDSNFFTKEITTKVVLHNDGRVRLRPTVLINGKQAKGASVLLSNSVEPYFVTQKVPIWGGPVSARVEVHTKVGQADGPTRQARSSLFVIPYVLLAGLVALVGFFFLVRWLWRKRGGKYAAIQADLRRFERLLEQQRAAGVETTGVAEEAELAIKAAIKQAGRSGDKDTEIKLRDKLAELREQEAAPSPPPSAPSAAPISAPAPAPVQAPASAPAPVPGRSRDDILPADDRAPAPVAGGGGDNNGVPPSPPPPADEAGERTVVAILRELAAAPPGARRFALIREARAQGLDVIEAHADELEAIPEDLRVRLLRDRNGHERAPQGSEIA